MGGPAARVLDFAGDRALPVPRATFQQAAQKGWRVVLNPVSIDPGLSLAVLIRMVHC